MNAVCIGSLSLSIMPAHGVNRQARLQPNIWAAVEQSQHVARLKKDKYKQAQIQRNNHKEPIQRFKIW